MASSLASIAQRRQIGQPVGCAGGVGGLSGTLVGAILLTLVLNVMNLLNIHSSWQPLVIGVIVLLAATIDVVARRRIEPRRDHKFKAGSETATSWRRYS